MVLLDNFIIFHSFLYTAGISNVPILSKKQQHITAISCDKNIESGWLQDAGDDGNVMLLSVWRNSQCVCVFFSNKSWQSLSEDCNVLSEKWKKCSDKLFLFSIHLISLFSQIFISCASQTYLIICQRRKWIRKLFLHFYQFVSVSNLILVSSEQFSLPLLPVGQFIRVITTHVSGSEIAS